MSVEDYFSSFFKSTMKIIYNDIIPFKGMLAITIWPFVFVRNGTRILNEVDINHESIHGRQQIEVLITSLLIIGILVLFAHISPWWFFLAPLIYFCWYGIEYFIKRYILGDKKAYRNLSMEKEAYGEEKNLEYLKTRKLFAWLKYL